MSNNNTDHTNCFVKSFRNNSNKIKLDITLK